MRLTDESKDVLSREFTLILREETSKFSDADRKVISKLLIFTIELMKGLPIKQRYAFVDILTRFSKVIKEHVGANYESR